MNTLRSGNSKNPRFVPMSKMSKKAQSQANMKKRSTWGPLNPVTRIKQSKKKYDRKVIKQSDRNNLFS